jgi:hypothetical protein
MTIAGGEAVPWLAVTGAGSNMLISPWATATGRKKKKQRTRARAGRQRITEGDDSKKRSSTADQIERPSAKSSDRRNKFAVVENSFAPDGRSKPEVPLGMS